MTLRAFLPRGLALLLTASACAPAGDVELAGDEPTPSTEAATACGANIAIARATASTDDGNVPANAIDGNLATRWSGLGVGAYLTLDLGASKSLCGVSIAWYVGDTRTNDFTLTFSTDGVTYGQAFSRTSSGTSAGLETYVLDAPRTARYVRLTFNGNSANNWASVSEITVAAASTAGTSTLWGATGERWSPTGRLQDYAFAGYENGLATPPSPAATRNVRDYGALGDGVHDDSDAFLAAIAATTSGALYVPAGTYVIKKRLLISRPNVVLRGAGRGQTTLYMPKSLGDLYGLTFNSAGQSQYSFGDAFVRIAGSIDTTTLTTVTANATRGGTQLTVASTSAITVGAWVQLSLSDPAAGTANAGTLLRHMHADLLDGGEDSIGDTAVRFPARVVAKTATTITLDRPLPTDVRTIWTPRIQRFAPTVHHSGVEDLTVRFAGSVYPGHFKERGYNAIELTRAVNCWVRNVTIVNADYGVSMSQDFFDSVLNVTLDTDFNRGSSVGHHGISLGGGGDNLVRGFVVNKTFVHDLTVDWYERQSVYAAGRGVNLNMDHHRMANYSNLFTDIDVGAGTRPFLSGGSSNRGAHAAAYATLWNVRAAVRFALPETDFAPKMNFVGVFTSSTTATGPQGLLEAIAPTSLAPQNIYDAMVARRRGTTSP